MVSGILSEAFSALIPLACACSGHITLLASTRNHSVYRRGKVILNFKLLAFLVLAGAFHFAGDSSLSMWCALSFAVVYMYRNAAIKSFQSQQRTASSDAGKFAPRQGRVQV